MLMMAICMVLVFRSMVLVYLPQSTNVYCSRDEELEGCDWCGGSIHFLRDFAVGRIVIATVQFVTDRLIDRRTL